MIVTEQVYLRAAEEYYKNDIQLVKNYMQNYLQ